jgi:hypothetical protein
MDTYLVQFCPAESTLPAIAQGKAGNIKEQQGKVTMQWEDPSRSRKQNY